jgi:NarL family two-component system response regulator LiaR
MKIKYLILYAFALAALTFLLNFLEYNFYINTLSIEFYLFAVAVLFASIGAYLAYTFAERKLIKKVNLKATITQSAKEDISLSAREKEVLICISLGLSNQEIANYLNLSIHTIKTHSSNLFSKLDVKRRTQAVKRAKELGILEHSIEEP